MNINDWVPLAPGDRLQAGDLVYSAVRGEWVRITNRLLDRMWEGLAAGNCAALRLSLIVEADKKAENTP